LVEAAAKEAAGIMPSRKPSQRRRTSRPKPTRRRALIAEVIGGYQGTVARYMGDGVLAYFGSCPVSFASASVNVSAMRNSISCASIKDSSYLD
jgi:hypothetical protein